MDPMIVQYLGFIVAALIIIWAVIEFNKRLSHRNRHDAGALNNWVELDTKSSTTTEDILPETTALNEENSAEAELHTRSSQNGHHAESQKPQI